MAMAMTIYTMVDDDRPGATHGCIASVVAVPQR
jgi:hypothetical protein